MFITQKKKPKRQIAVNTSMYIKERFKAPRDICQSTFKVTGQTPGLFGYCSSTSTLIPDSGPKSALEIWKELLMSSPASLLRGCEILLHFTAHISTVGYVTPHLKGTRSKEVILPFSPPHTLFKLLAGANSSSLGTSMSSEGFTLGQSQPTITDLTVFLFFWRAFSFFFQMVGYCSSHNSLCSSQHPGSQEPQSSKDAVSWNQELKDSFLHLSLFLLAGDHITPYCWKPQRVPLLSENKVMVVAGRGRWGDGLIFWVTSVFLLRTSPSYPGSWWVSLQQEEAKLQRLAPMKLPWLRCGRDEVRKLASALSLPSLACLNKGDAANPTPISLCSSYLLCFPPAPIDALKQQKQYYCYN